MPAGRHWKGKEDASFTYQFVNKNRSDGHGNHITDQEDIGPEETEAQSATIGHLTLHHPAVQIPSHKETDDDSAHGEDKLGGNEIKEIKDGHPKQSAVTQQTERECTQAGEGHAATGHPGGSSASGHACNLKQISRDGLVERHGAGKGCQDEEHIEEAAEYISHHRH